METEEKKLVLLVFVATIFSGLLVNIFVVAFWDWATLANAGLIALSDAILIAVVLIAVYLIYIRLGK